jgi:arsenite methyltransferase
MTNTQLSSPQQISELGFSYFELQALWGFTKHFGGLKATDELAEMCHIDRDAYVLEIGCGVGTTTCHLAKKYGCRVIGIDLSEKMVEWSRTRARRKDVTERVELRQADAQNLPFQDAHFDVVISESVTTFVEDKPKALCEYARVTKPGGYVALNEGTWNKPSPPPELVKYTNLMLAGAVFMTADEWKQLLEGSHLREIVVRPHKLNMVSQGINEMRGLDFYDFMDQLRGVNSFMSLSIKSPAFRQYAKAITPSPKIIMDFFAYLGYGTYVGRK